ncbi:hypothetical protein GCM10020295_83190 [Streptomyces cinereospinus]
MSPVACDRFHRARMWSAKVTGSASTTSGSPARTGRLSTARFRPLERVHGVMGIITAVQAAAPSIGHPLG